MRYKGYRHFSFQFAPTAMTANQLSHPVHSHMPIQIIEILGPSDQGKSRPYKCRAEDGAIYFVKGRQTNRASLWHEWICGHLAQQFGLNVPAFALVEIGPELLAEAPPDWRDIGCGPAFGSRQYPNTLWFEPGWAEWVPESVQRDVLVFDWWVRNGDRLTGNTNLLWDAAAKALVVMDHNLAFDAEFSMSDFVAHHVFAAQWPAVCGDWVIQAHYAQRLTQALQVLPMACDNSPPDWWWANAEMDVPANFDLKAVQQTLSRCATPELWRSV